MTNISQSNLSPALLATVIGGGNAPLGGNVKQSINTNWGGSQTNIGTQIINPPPPPPPPTVTEFLRTNPAARLHHIQQMSRTVR